MTEYQILFLGDVVGKSGRKAVQEWLPSLQDQFRPLFTIINGENSAGGLGITAEIAREFFEWGADAITLGNHSFNKRDIGKYMETEHRIVRPNNMSVHAPGTGVARIEKAGIKFAVANLCGRVSMDPQYGDPFAEVDRFDAIIETPHRFLDFHAEATSEKIAMGYYCDGRFTAVVGTHTHVQTADETILDGGTAYITDSGMCGPANSVLGMEKELILRRFKTGMPEKFEVSDEPSVICGVVISVESDTGRAVSIERIRRGPGT